jgi:glycosyltransferase involved in cell wall biosynthesis
MRRILINGKFLSQRTTGVQRVAAEIVRGLDELSAAGETQDLSLAVACPANGRGLAAPASVKLQPVGRLKGVAWEQLELPAFAGGDLLVNLCNMGPLVRSGDVVYIHDAQFLLSPQSYSAAFRQWYRFALPLLARRASRVVTVSRYAAETLVQFGVVRPEKLTVIHNGVDHILRITPDPGALAAHGLMGRPFVVAPANTQRHKNIPVLFEAFRSAALADVALVLVGAATAEDFARAGSPPPPNAIFAGPVPDAAMRALIEGATAFAFPSTTEGFGLPPLEAMLLGTPAVAAPRGALPELCGDAVLYADPDAPEAWAAALRRLVDEAPLRQTFAAAGRAQAGRYRWSQSARELVSLLRGVL